MEKYLIFEKLLSQSFEVVTNKGKEMMVKNLMPNSKDFKHLFRPDYVLKHNGHTFVIEIEGGVFSNGRHSRGAGMINDMLKYNALISVGIPILRFESNQIKEHPIRILSYIQRFADGSITTQYISDFIAFFKK